MTTLINGITCITAPAITQEPSTHYPPESLRQFNEMTLPRDVAGETSHKLMAKEKEASQALAQKCSQITDQEIGQLLEVIDTLDFKNDAILLNPKLPHIALEALRRGLLDPTHGQKQVATILSFWSALQYHQDPAVLQILSVFDHTPTIKETFKHSFIKEMDPFLEGDKFDLFIKKMQDLPLSEQHFLLVPDIQGDDSIATIVRANGGNPYKASISQATKASGVNVFNRVNDHGTPMRIIPSAGMMQAFLEAQYGEDAVEIKPRVYLSTLRHIYDNRLTDTCDMMIPTPDAEGKNRCPSTADGFQAPWYDFFYHDFYHAILTSAVGRTYRKAAIVASDVIRAYAKTAPVQDQKGLNQLAVSLIDMDFALFHHYLVKPPHRSRAHTFWLTITQQISIQKIKVIANDALKRKGVTPPFRADPISSESELEMFNAVYHAFVHEKREPAELNKESFQAAAKIYKTEIADNEDLSTTLTVHPILRLGKKLGVTGL